MNPNPLSNKETLVLAVGMDARKQAVFRMAFKMYRKCAYRLLEPGDDHPPHLAIIDVDHPEGLAVWERFRSEHPQLPALIVSMHTMHGAPAPILQKPIRMETLFPQLEALRSGHIVALASVNPAPGDAPAPSAPTSSGHQPSPIRAVPEAAAAGEPATRRNTSPLNAAEPPQAPAAPAASEPPKPVFEIRAEEIQYFDPRSGLFGLLQSIKRDRMAATVITSSGQPIMIVNPAADEVRLLVADAELHRFARDEKTLFRGRMPHADDEPADTAVRKTTFIALLWQIAVWAASGRLIKTLRVNTPVQLRYWPNLTRLAPIPNAIRLAAFLTRSPVNPVLTVKMLQVAPKDLFNFLAAAHSIDLLQLPQAQPAPASASGAANTPRPEPAAPKPQQRGFLMRLLKKISGM